MLWNKFTAAFNRFQSRFTYRQKFIFLALLFALAIPAPAYWNLRMCNFFIANAQSHQEGMRYERLYLNLLDLVSQHGILTTDQLVAGRSKSNTIKLLGVQINSLFDELDAQMENPPNAVKEDPITGNPTRKVIYPLSAPLRDIWMQIVDFEDKQLTNETLNYSLHVSMLRRVAEQIYYLNDTFDLTLTIDEAYLGFSRILLDKIPNLYILTADLSMQQILNLGQQTDDKRIPLLAYELKNSVINLRTFSNRVFRAFSNDPKHHAFLSYNEGENALEQMLNDFKLFGVIITSISGGAVETSAEQISKISLKTLASLKVNAESLTLINEVILESIIKKYQRHKFYVLAILYLSCVFIAAYLVFHILSGHLLKLMTYIESISNGQFAIDLKINTKDAVGQIGSSFNRMGHEINDVVTQLQEVSSQLEAFSHKIALMADDQESLVVEQESNFQHLEAITGEIAKKSRDLANVMNALISSSRDILLSSGSRLGLDEMQQNMTSLVNVSRGILGSLSKVSDKVSKARHLIHFMTRVSDQAHLLSLNAAIETLNIGKHRQLFSEITTQIQRFAETTASSTNDIQKIVSDMFTRVTSAQNTAKNCIKEINVGVNRLLTVGTQLTSITKEGEKQTEKFDGVNHVMQEQAEAAESIINTIKGLSDAARENTSSIRHLRQTLDELAKTTHELHNVLNLFFVHDKSKLIEGYEGTASS